MTALPFMPLYVADYLADTTHLSTEAHGAYLLLLMVLWKSGGELQNDDKILARIVRLSPAKWERIKDDVLEFFQIVENKIFHNRVTQEIQKAKNLGEVRSEVGKRGVEAKRLKSQEPPQAIASDLLKQTPQQTVSKPLPSHTSDSIEEDGLRRGREAVQKYDGLRSQLLEAAGWQTKRSSGGLEVIGPIIALIAAGADLELDVLPVIRRDAPRCNGSNWNYFTNAIAQARDHRIRASKIISPERTGHERNRTKRKGNLELVHEAIFGGDGQGDPPLG